MNVNHFLTGLMLTISWVAGLGALLFHSMGTMGGDLAAWLFGVVALAPIAVIGAAWSARARQRTPRVGGQ